MIPSKNSDFFRRLRFYGFGFLIGILGVISIKGKSCRMQMPGSAKLDELGSQPLTFCADSSCSLTRDEVKTLIGFIDKNGFTEGKGKVNYDLSDVRKATHPYPTYAVEGTTGKGKVLLYIADRDTISAVIKIITPKDSCVCE